MEVKGGKRIPSLFLWEGFKYKPFRERQIWLFNQVLTQNVHAHRENTRAKEEVGRPYHREVCLFLNYIYINSAVWKCTAHFVLSFPLHTHRDERGQPCPLCMQRDGGTGMHSSPSLCGSQLGHAQAFQFGL